MPRQVASGKDDRLYLSGTPQQRGLHHSVAGGPQMSRLGEAAAKHYGDVFRRDRFNRDRWILLFKNKYEQAGEGLRGRKPKKDYGDRNANSKLASSPRKRQSQRCNAEKKRKAKRIDKNWKQFFDIVRHLLPNA
jgi:hypothetical protein